MKSLAISCMLPNKQYSFEFGIGTTDCDEFGISRAEATGMDWTYIINLVCRIEIKAAKYCTY
jgi:hypothetical protein